MIGYINISMVPKIWIMEKDEMVTITPHPTPETPYIPSKKEEALKKLPFYLRMRRRRR